MVALQGVTAGGKPRLTDQVRGEIGIIRVEHGMQRARRAARVPVALTQDGIKSFLD